MAHLAKEVLKLYREIGWKTYFYTKIRWRLCPIEKIAQYVGVPAKLLELGCGVGMLSNYVHLRDPETQVLGIDLSPTRIACAEATVGNRTGIRFLCKNALELDSQTNFDTVTMTDFLHHLSFEGQKGLLEFLYRQLPRGGRLVILEVIECPAWKRKFADLVDRLLNHGKISHFRSKKEWESFLEEIGFEVEVQLAHRGLPLADAIFVAVKPSDGAQEQNCSRKLWIGGMRKAAYPSV